METTKVPGIRQTAQGRWEATIQHPLLPKRVFRNFDSEGEAGRYKLKMLQFLDAGVVPNELTPAGARTNQYRRASRARRTAAAAPLVAVPGGNQSPTLASVLGAYLESAPIAKSDRSMVESLRSSVQGRIDGVTTLWGDDWVRSMKKDRLAPGTIRKKVESMARALEWWWRRERQADAQPTNPLRLFPKGYSNYGPNDIRKGEEAPVDVERDRRCDAEEEARCVRVLEGWKRDDRQRPWATGGDKDFLMLFRLIINTGLRLREAYRLRRRDLKFDLRTIHVAKSKTGRRRDVPMTRYMEGLLRDYIEGRNLQPDDIIFPYWRGEDDEGVLKAISQRLSSRFSGMFAYAGSEDITEHDLRHEATIRWMLMKDKTGQWMFRTEEVKRITGHKNQQTFERYLSIRGSDLAERMD